VTSGPGDEALAEQLLVLRAQLGGREAWAQLIRRYHARLVFYLRRLLGTAADADDAAQDVWLAVVRKLHTLDEPAAFRSWLYRIARHRALSQLRRPVREIGLEEAGPLGEAEAIDETDEGFTPDEAAAVFAALDTLSPVHREVLSLRCLAGLRYEEIATVMECGVGTVRSRLHYAKAAVRAAVTRSAGEEHG